MKKLLWLMTFMTMTLGAPILKMAAVGGTITQESGDPSGKINVEYSMGVTYTVTIPASVTFTDAEKRVERSLQVTDVMLNEGSSLNVSIASQNDFQMKNGSSYIDYYIMYNGSTAEGHNHFKILTVSAGDSSGWVLLDFMTDLNKENAMYAGSYTDTLTFTVSIE